MDVALEKQLMVASQVIEQTLDSEIDRLDNLDGDELELIRRERMTALKKRNEKKQDWMAAGHGEYMELNDEKEFFEVTKKSGNVCCHFFREGFDRCKIVDKHLALLARKHIETKFCKINAEKAPFLTERLHIRILPTLSLVKEGKTKDFIVGFADLGNKDDFTTEMLEWRIARSDVIEYSGDLMHPPKSKAARQQNLQVLKKKTIKGGRYNDGSDSDSD